MAATDEHGSAAEERAQLRAGLLDQLAHLIREVDMLEGVIARVPEKLLAEAPPDEDRSIKELFALIARRDAAVHRPRAERIVADDAAAGDAAAGDAPRFGAPEAGALLGDADWNARPVAEIFAEVRTARSALIETLEAAPPAGWLRTGHFPAGDGEAGGPPQERDLYWMAHALCQDDAARLERMTRRLYDSHMGPPPQPGPNGAP